MDINSGKSIRIAECFGTKAHPFSICHVKFDGVIRRATVRETKIDYQNNFLLQFFNVATKTRL